MCDRGGAVQGTVQQFSREAMDDALALAPLINGAMTPDWAATARPAPIAGAPWERGEVGLSVNRHDDDRVTVVTLTMPVRDMSAPLVFEGIALRHPDDDDHADILLGDVLATHRAFQAAADYFASYVEQVRHYPLREYRQ